MPVKVNVITGQTPRLSSRKPALLHLPKTVKAIACSDVQEQIVAYRVGAINFIGYSCLFTGSTDV